MSLALPGSLHALMLSRPTQTRNSGRAEHCWIAGCHGGDGEEYAVHTNVHTLQMEEGLRPLFFIATITLMAAVPRVFQRILTRVPWQPTGTVFTFP